MQANITTNNNVQNTRNNHQTVLEFSSVPECRLIRQDKVRYTLL